MAGNAPAFGSSEFQLTAKQALSSVGWPLDDRKRQLRRGGWLPKAVCEAECHSPGYGLRFRAPIWTNRAGAKPFSGRGYKTSLFE